MLTLQHVAEFTWDFGCNFLLEVNVNGEEQIWIWSDPDYNGDNTIRRYPGTLKDYFSNGAFGRDKGKWTIEGYCGPDVKIIQ